MEKKNEIDNRIGKKESLFKEKKNEKNKNHFLWKKRSMR